MQPAKRDSCGNRITSPVAHIDGLQQPDQHDSVHNRELKLAKVSQFEVRNVCTCTYMFSCNQLTFLPYELKLCTQLEVLSVSHNRLTALPELLERLTNLKELNLSQNRIQLLTSLPTSLTYLNLSGNQLEALPEVATRLVNLTELNLEGNKLKKLPAMLVNMVSLKRLKIEFNPLQDIDPSTTAQEILMQLQKQREEAKRAQVKVGNVATSSKRPRTPTPPQEGPEVDKPPEDTKLQPPAARKTCQTRELNPQLHNSPITIKNKKNPRVHPVLNQKVNEAAMYLRMASTATPAWWTRGN